LLGGKAQKADMDDDLFDYSRAARTKQVIAMSASTLLYTTEEGKGN
jgi:hypothetical protein